MVNQSIIDTAKRLIQSIPESIEIKKAFWLALILKGKGNEHAESDTNIANVVGKKDDFFLFKCN